MSTKKTKVKVRKFWRLNPATKIIKDKRFRIKHKKDIYDDGYYF